MTHTSTKNRRKRKEAAQERQGAGSPDPAAQLAVLDSRLGKGRGAKKERAKLHALIEGPKKNTKKGKKS